MGIKLGANRYSVEGDIVTLYVDRRDGTTVETLIDYEDLEKVLKYRWHVSKTKGDMYVKTEYRRGGVRVTLYLHRYVLGAEGDIVVDHIKGNTLDNRKSQLRIVTHKENIKNRTKMNRNNTSGTPNVYYRKDIGRWLASVWDGKRNIYLGYHATVEEATKAVNNYKQFND